MPTSPAPLAAGTHTLGPDDASLTVHTKKGGAAAKAGHNLTIEVTAWEATVEVGEEISMSLTADAHSLKVRDGHGGVTPLGNMERSSIEQSIDEEVLEGTAIEFRSTNVAVVDGGLEVDGELELNGKRRPLSFELTAGDGGALTGAATFKQSDWGMKPYSALFGTLKVLDEVRVEFTTNERTREE
jgi:polyisoprenoid-binding protein YceI